MNTPRLAPLLPQQLSSEQASRLKPLSNKQGQYHNIFGTLVRNVELFDAWSGFGLYTMHGSRVEATLREILILRTAINNDCDYEWHHHRHIGKKLGMSDDLLERIKRGSALDTDEQTLMLKCADELAADGMLGTGTWEAMTKQFGENYTLDAIFTVGAYTALGMGLRSAGVQLEANA